MYRGDFAFWKVERKVIDQWQVTGGGQVCTGNFASWKVECQIRGDRQQVTGAPFLVWISVQVTYFFMCGLVTERCFVWFYDTDLLFLFYGLMHCGLKGFRRY